MKKAPSSSRFSIRLSKKNQAKGGSPDVSEGATGGGSEAAAGDEESEFFGQTLGGIPKPPRRQGLYYVPGKDIVNGMEQGTPLSWRLVTSFLSTEFFFFFFLFFFFFFSPRF